MLWIIFSKLFFCLLSLLMLLPQIERMVPLHATTVDVWRTSRSCCNFKVWATWGATSSRRRKNKVHLLHFFSTLKIYLHFQFGFRFMIALLCLLSEFISTWTMLQRQFQHACWSNCCWSDCCLNLLEWPLLEQLLLERSLLEWLLLERLLLEHKTDHIC